MKKLLFILILFAATFANSQEIIKTCKVTKTCTLETEPAKNTGTTLVKKGKKVDIIGFDGNYYKAIFNNEVGYLHQAYVVDAKLMMMAEKIKEEKKKQEEKRALDAKQDYLQKQKEAELKRNKEIEQKKIRDAEQKQELYEKAKQQLAERKKELIVTYGEVKANKILNNIVWLGMSKNEAIESWGRPNDINTTKTFNGESEQWVYRKSRFNHKYLYFENGILKTIQE